jgi:hypothetical protein
VTPHQAAALSEPDELDVLQGEFHAYVIWREVMPMHSRYVARSRYLAVNPHTVVTADIGELRTILRKARMAWQRHGLLRPDEKGTIND